MRFSKAWIVARKDLLTIQKNKQIVYTLVMLSLIASVLFPIILLVSGPAALDVVSSLANSNTLFFILIAAELPAVIGSYSIVGEKIEKSLEPLLATPTTDEELLLGKNLAAFIPSIALTFISAAISLTLFEVWSIINLGILFSPSIYWLMTVFLIAPLACVLSVETCVIISSKVNDVRAATQLSTFVVLPIIFLAVFGALETFLISMIIIVILAVLDIVLTYVSKATFKREEILTKWK